MQVTHDRDLTGMEVRGRWSAAAIILASLRPGSLAGPPLSNRRNGTGGFLSLTKEAIHSLLLAKKVATRSSALGR